MTTTTTTTTPATVPTWATLLGEVSVDQFTGTNLAHTLAAVAVIDGPTNHGVRTVRIAHLIDAHGGRIDRTYVDSASVRMYLQGANDTSVTVYRDGLIGLHGQFDLWDENDGTVLTALRLIRKHLAGE